VADRGERVDVQRAGGGAAGEPERRHKRHGGAARYFAEPGSRACVPCW
jgi:hypothetical protein